MLGFKKKQENRYVLEPSDEEMKAVFGIIEEFRLGMANFEEPLPYVENVFLGCTAESIHVSHEAWDFFDESMPPLGVFTNIGAMSQGDYESITPVGFGIVMFEGPRSKDVLWSLAMALVWERDRRKNGEVEGVHLPMIHDNLSQIVGYLNENAAAIDFSDED